MCSTTNLDKHKLVAEANKSLYNTSTEISDDFQKFAEIPYVSSRIAKTVADCISRVTPKENIIALDVGTGFGHLLAHLTSHVPPQNIYAIDIAKKNIAVARERFPGINFYVGDFIEDFELPTRADLITCYSVLHHFYDWKSFLHKADMLLNPSGVMYLDHEPLGSFVTKMYELLARIKNRDREDLLLAEYHQFHGHVNPFEVEQYLSSLRYHVEIYYTNIPLIGGIIKKVKLDISPFVINELRINSRVKGMLRHGFLSYKVIAQKLGT